MMILHSVKVRAMIVLTSILVDLMVTDVRVNDTLDMYLIMFCF